MGREASRFGRRMGRTRCRERPGARWRGNPCPRVFRTENSRARIVARHPGTNRAIGRARRRIPRGRDRAMGWRYRVPRCAISCAVRSSCSFYPFWPAACAHRGRKHAPSVAWEARLPLARSSRESLRVELSEAARDRPLADQPGPDGGIPLRTYRGIAEPFHYGQEPREERKRLRGRGRRVLWGDRASECLAVLECVASRNRKARDGWTGAIATGKRCWVRGVNRGAQAKVPVPLKAKVKRAGETPAVRNCGFRWIGTLGLLMGAA